MIRTFSGAALTRLPPESSVRLPTGFRQHCAVQPGGIGGGTQPLKRFRVSQSSRDACERIERITLRLGRKQKQEDDIDRLAVNCFKIDGIPEANQDAERLLQIRYPRMRDGDATSGPGRPQMLAFQEFNGNAVGSQVEGCRRPGGEFVQQPRLVRYAHVDQRVGWRKKIFDFHGRMYGLSGFVSKYRLGSRTYTGIHRPSVR